MIGSNSFESNHSHVGLYRPNGSLHIIRDGKGSPNLDHLTADSGVLFALHQRETFALLEAGTQVVESVVAHIGS